jgi:Carboxypeptidase regulatory-like domain/TonB dependent receptor
MSTPIARNAASGVVPSRIVPIALFLCVLMCTQSSSAQVDRGSISGTVTETTGGVLGGSKVTVRNVGTGQEIQVLSDDQGNYTARLLIGGSYSVLVEKTGFRTVQREGVEVHINQVAIENFVLQVGSVSEKIEVQAIPSLVDTETSSMGTLETERRIEQLPLNGRNFIQLAYLGPGADQGPQNNGALRGTTDNNRPGIQVAVNGLTSFDNNFLLDGVDNNEYGQGTIVIQPPPDAIQEFRVEQNSMKAEFGRGGASVNIVLKSGTNQLHGGAYEYFRNSALDADNYFDQPLPGQTKPFKPPFQQNQFGVFFGGPVKKDRTFFFADYEGTRIHVGKTYLSTLPTAAEHAGDFTVTGATIYDPYTTNPQTGARQPINPNPATPSVIPSNRIDLVGKKIVDLLPLPNLPGLVNNYLSNPKNITNGNQFDARVDHRLSGQDQLFAHGSLQNVDFLKAAPLGNAGGCCSGLGSNINGREQSYAIGWTHAFGTNWLNDARIALVRWRIDTNHVNANKNISDTLGIPNANRGDGVSGGLSLFFVNGYGYNGSSFGDSQFVPELAVDNTRQVADTVSWVHGKHAFKFGGDFRYLTRNFFQAQAPFGLFNVTGNFTSNLQTSTGGNAIADILLGLPQSRSQDSLASRDRTNQKEIDAFFQDDWRVTHNLTLNLGLRYEVFSPVGGHVGNFNLATGVVVNNFGPNAVSNAGVAYDLHNFGPRIGFAWSPFSKDRTVVRSAFGIFYGPEGNVFNDLGENPPVLESYAQRSNALDVPTAASLFSAGFPAQQLPEDPLHPAGNQVKTTGPERRIPYFMEWNFGIEQQLAADWMLDVGYVGTRGVHIWDNESSNFDQALKPLDTNFQNGTNFGTPYYQQDPNLSVVLPIDYPHFDIFYNALQVKLVKRFSQGLNLQAGYTWSKDIGNSCGDPGCAIENTYNIKLERGLEEPDFRHRFTLSGLYELPFGRGRHFGNNWGNIADGLAGGWQLSSIVTIRGGEVETAYMGAGDLSNTGSFGYRPDLIGNPSDFSFGVAEQAALGCPTPGRRSLQCWYNPAAFATPALAPGQVSAHVFGDSGNGDIRGPGQVNFDFGIMKQFHLTERQKLDFRAELFNAFNHPQFQIPNSNPDSPGGASITSTLPDNQREIQFSLRWSF